MVYDIAIEKKKKKSNQQVSLVEDIRKNRGRRGYSILIQAICLKKNIFSLLKRNHKIIDKIVTYFYQYLFFISRNNPILKLNFS